MRATPNLNFTSVEPTTKSLKTFVTMLRSVYQHLTDVVNGKLGFGDGTNHDNIDGSWINVVAPVAPNTDFVVNHNLTRLPVGYLVMSKDRACDVYTGSVGATKTQLTLRATVASAVLRLFVVGLLLGLFVPQSEAQGFAVTGTAQRAVTPPGNLGISGQIVETIPSAVVSVCPGAVLPAAGTICSPVNSLLFSNVGLTTSISNPTNADLFGNYIFYVNPGASYIVSISGTGVTTYSYTVTAPLVTAISSGANTALSNLAAVSINTSLFPQTGVDLGSATNQFRNLFLFGSGVYGVNYFQDTGTPTGVRTQTKQDASDTYVYRATADTLTNKTFSLASNTLLNSVNTIGHYGRNNGTQYVDSAILTTDLPASASTCSGNNFMQGWVAGGTPSCTGPAIAVATVVNLTTQQANIGVTTLITPGANGFYRASCYAVVTQAATTSSNLPTCSVLWTDGDSSFAEPAQAITAANNANTVGAFAAVGNITNTFSFFAKSGAAISYQTAGYASVGGTPMQYALHFRLEGPF
jgi:hypothetical protein